jgi:hypothetical protein
LTARVAFGLGPRDLVRRFATVAAGIGLHHAGIDGEPLALDQAGIHARTHHSLEYLAEDVAVTEPTVPIDRECRMIRHLVVEIEAAKPPVRKVRFELFAQPPLEADAIAIADDQHSDHKLGINRRPANVAIEGRKLVANLNQYPCHDRIDPAQQMVRWDAPFEVEKVKQLALIARLSTHHGKPLPLQTESLFAENHEPFFNTIDPERTLRPLFEVD